jgi:hypothetical protein
VQESGKGLTLGRRQDDFTQEIQIWRRGVTHQDIRIILGEICGFPIDKCVIIFPLRRSGLFGRVAGPFGWKDATTVDVTGVHRDVANNLAKGKQQGCGNNGTAETFHNAFEYTKNGRIWLHAGQNRELTYLCGG